MKKLALITCYMGILPNYFQSFANSCALNENIDFFVITNDGEKRSLPSNVFLINRSFESIRRLIKEKIGIWANLASPYKLCDYKPTYGLLFSDLLAGYDYWGHCDIDLVWGRLEQIVFPILDLEYDKLFKFGHLSIYRNCDKMNNLFKSSYSGLSYKVVFSSNISCGFDEMKGMWILGEENRVNQYHEQICYDIMRPFSCNTLKSYNIDNYYNQCFLYKDGRVIRVYESDEGIGEDEMAYIHFQKRNIQSNIGSNDCIFQFTSVGFIPVNENDLKKLFDANKDYRSFVKGKQFKFSEKYKALKFKLFKIYSSLTKG